jgi:hypothetical protein
VLLLPGHHPRAAGGNGAPGGAVILRASKQLTGLGSIPMHVEANRGGSGGKQWMEGRRGADKVVEVPLGTLVWQLVEMRQAPGSTAAPHGVTPLPRMAAAAPAATVGAAAASRHVQQQQPQQQSLEHFDHGMASTAQRVGHSNGTTSSTGRRKLFQESSQQQQQQQQEPQHGLPAAAAHPTAASTGQLRYDEADADSDTNTLYDELLSCRRLLSNAEKLWLLNHGTLPTPQQLLRHHAAMLGPAAAAASDYTDSDEDDDGTADGSSDDEQLSDDDGDWVVLPLAAGDEAAAAAAGAASWMDDMDTDRQFTKQQVGFGGEVSREALLHVRSGWCCLFCASPMRCLRVARGGGVGSLQRRYVQRLYVQRLYVPPQVASLMYVWLLAVLCLLLLLLLLQVWSILQSQAVLLGELTRDGQELRVAVGGKGGRGNATSPSKPYGPASRARSDGQPGQEVRALLLLLLQQQALSGAGCAAVCEQAAATCSCSVRLLLV